MNPLVERILAVRVTLAGMESEPHKTNARRQDIVRQSKFLEGLEVAATLVLSADDLRILLDDLTP